MKLSIKRYKVITDFLLNQKYTLISAFLLIVISSLIDLIYPYITGILIDEVFYQRNINFLAVAILCFIILFIGNQILFLINHLTTTYLYTKVLFDIRQKVFDRILHLKASYLTNKGTGDLITHINQDTDKIMDLVCDTIFFQITDLVRLVTIFLIIMKINQKIALLLLVSVPIVVYSSQYFGKKIKEEQNVYREKYGVFISWVFELTKGIREIRLLGSDNYVINKFSDQCNDLLDIEVKTNMAELNGERVNSFISLLLNLVLYIVIAIFVVNGEMTIGLFLATVDYFYKAIRFFNNFNKRHYDIQKKLVSIKKIVELLNEEVEEDNGTNNHTFKSTDIQFEDVSFRYIEGKQILNNMNLEIKNGEMVAIVGMSGAGKSTLINLVNRLYIPNEGTIKIDSVDIRDIPLKLLRKQVGIVQQDLIVFDGSIRDNLRIANHNCIEDEIWTACKKVNIADFIYELPDKLDTVLGTDGINLSGGQKQRLTIARALLKNPKILIMDEATSSLDNDSEQIISNSLKDVRVGRTVIIISHRLSTVLEADRVAVLQDGNIIAFDNHKKLMNSCELYKTLFKEQILMQKWRETVES